MIGSKIRELRREKMWQQKDLANAIGMSAHTISLWETGRMRPSDNAIKEMAKLFGVPVEYLTSDGAGKSKDGSAEMAALLKVAENEINQLKEENQRLKEAVEDKSLKVSLMDKRIEELREQNTDLKNEITFLKNRPIVEGAKDKLDLEKANIEIEKLKETIVHLAMKGVFNG